jgi:hypothetical protein
MQLLHMAVGLWAGFGGIFYSDNKYRTYCSKRFEPPLMGGPKGGQDFSVFKNWPEPILHRN